MNDPTNLDEISESEDTNFQHGVPGRDQKAMTIIMSVIVLRYELIVYGGVASLERVFAYEYTAFAHMIHDIRCI